MNTISLHTMSSDESNPLCSQIIIMSVQNRWEDYMMQIDNCTTRRLQALEACDKVVFVKRKCEQKGPKKVSTFSTRFHVVSNAFPKYQMLTF